MSAINTFPYSWVENIRRIDPLRIRRFTVFALTLFFASLPFHSVEWPLLGIDRFEIKITMITFFILLAVWVISRLHAPRRISREERWFYTLAFVYGASQFLSLANSPFPSRSFIQSIIVSVLLLMMIVVSQLMRDKKLVQYAYSVMGIVALIWGGYIFGAYQYLTDMTERLGQRGTVFITGWQGDPAFFGDVLLFVTGSVYWIFFWLAERKIGRFVIWILIPLWLYLIIVSYTKALIPAVFLFFVIGIILHQRRRRMIMFISCILFIILTIFFGPISSYTSEGYQKLALRVATVQQQIKGLSIAYLVSKAPAPPTPVTPEPTPVVPATPPTPVTPEPTPVKTSKTIAWRKKILVDRFNPFTPGGVNSMDIRWRAMYISLNGSLDHFFFGNGAGLSQVLLPKLAHQFDTTRNEIERACDEYYNLYGPEANESIIDAHNLFLTELFNIGIIGALALVGLVVLVIKRQIRALRDKAYRHDTIYALLLSTFVALLLYRMAGSYIVVPYFWVMLGVLFGLSEKEKIL